MTTPEHEKNIFPDNVYFDGHAVSWNGESEDGNDARFGVIKSGFNEVFPIPESGERIWLHEPSGKQFLVVKVLDLDGIEIAGVSLSGASVLHVQPEHLIRVQTPLGQGEVAYMCDYPGVEPGAQH